MKKKRNKQIYKRLNAIKKVSRLVEKATSLSAEIMPLEIREGEDTLTDLIAPQLMTAHLMLQVELATEQAHIKSK